MEIGVAGGASLRTWRKFFANARIVGADINPDCRKHADHGAGIFVEIGSQNDPAFLLSLARQYRPSIIIDDGSHQADHIQFAFEWLFPALEPSGCYVIEDFEFHFGAQAKRHTGMATTPMPDYLGMLVRSILGEPDTITGHAAQWMDYAEVFGGAAAIWKKSATTIGVTDCAAIEAALDLAGKNAAWPEYAGKLIAAGMLDRAAAAACRGIECAPQSWVAFARMGEVHERNGDLNAALRAVVQSLALTRTEAETTLMRQREASLRERGAA